MNAVAIDQIGSTPTLRDDLPEPAPGTGEVLVRVTASSANPIDNGIVAGMLQQMLPHEFPIILGRDFAGVVEQVGDGVGSVSAGDEVFGVLPPSTGGPVHDGAWAERIVSSEQTLARRPAGVGTAAAGAAGLAAITAIALVDALDLSPGDTVLIVGATGGVGSIAAQLAVAAGATVIAPGRPDDEAFLREVGVSEVVPRDGDVVAAVRGLRPDGVAAIIDNVSMGATGVYDGALADGGRVASATSAAGEGPGRTDVLNAPSPQILERVARHLADGTVEVPIQRTYPLDRAADALADLAAGPTRGKLAISVA